VGTTLLLRRLALASLVANVGLVVTGGAVRLTGSGLGCPTWPSCTDASYTTTAAMGVHGAVEFGNRILGIVVGLLALACVVVAVAARRAGRAPVGWSVLVLLGIPLQAVIGGITVLTKLNPWVVACHFLGSMAVLVAAYQLWLRTRPPAPAPELPRPIALLVRGIVAVTAVVLVVGTVVTGSGPHAGDEHARRTGLDPQQVSQLHADLVFLLIGLSVGLVFALRAVGAPAAANRAAGRLVGVELAQAVIGLVQYFTGLPALAVALHMLGASLVWLAALAVLAATRSPASAAMPAALFHDHEELRVS